MKWLQGLLKDSTGSEEPTPIAPEAPLRSGENLQGANLPVPTTEEAIPPSSLAEVPVREESSSSGMTTPEAPASLDLSPLLSRLDDLVVRQNELQQCFDNRLRSDEVQGKTLERLHDELQQYKANFLRQAITPLLKEVIFCHDFAVQQQDKLRQGENAEAGAAALDAVRQMLVDVLFKFDVEPFRRDEEVETTAGGTEASVAFDPRTQQCLKTLPTDQPELDKRIAARGACGFRSGETILRRELVSVYKYSGSPKLAAGEPGSEGAVVPAVNGIQTAAQ